MGALRGPMPLNLRTSRVYSHDPSKYTPGRLPPARVYSKHRASTTPRAQLSKQHQQHQFAVKATPTLGPHTLLEGRVNVGGGKVNVITDKKVLQ